MTGTADHEAQFSLITYLRADLLRQAGLLGQGARGRWGLWRGMFSPRFMPVLLCRLAHASHRSGMGVLAKCFALLNFFLFGIEIAARCPIGRGLFLPHTQGTVIGAWAIGENATIFQGVTLGARELDFTYSEAARPVLGSDVTIGAGAKVLGNVMIGNGSCVGANAVVVDTLPPGVLAVGVPAKAVKLLGKMD